MRFLVGTVAHNQHIGNIVRAFYEVDALASFYTGGVDLFKSHGGRLIRSWASRLHPHLEARLSRRKILGVPPELISPSWRWEVPRLAARDLHMGVRVVDWIWERGELDLDQRCARMLSDDRFSAYLGVEHGALASLQVARSLGKTSVVAFFSPHHATRAEWVDPEYDRHPELLTPAIRKIRDLAKIRDARRDQEARTADIVHCASEFTARSLMRAGLVTPQRLTIVPLGCPPVPIPNASAPAADSPVRFVWSGTVALHKGIGVLLEAWRGLRPGRSAELHIYGAIALPRRFLHSDDANVVFHGPVSATAMALAYQKATALVFPTLCDGFGMVIAEAFSHGLPVITTRNAGASDLVRDGENGFLVPARDAERLAERLEWCIRHREELRAMRSTARETALGWTWQHFRSLFRTQLTQRLGCDLGPRSEYSSRMDTDAVVERRVSFGPA